MTEQNHVSIVELGQSERRLRQGHADPQPPPRPGLRAALAGVNVSPQLAAAARSIVYIVLVALIDCAIIFLTNTPPPWLVAYTVVIIGALRLIEGVVDSALKPDQNMTEPRS